MDQRTYFRSRMLAERQAARKAALPKAAAIHRELADRYEAVLRACEPGAEHAQA